MHMAGLVIANPPFENIAAAADSAHIRDFISHTSSDDKLNFAPPAAVFTARISFPLIRSDKLLVKPRINAARAQQGFVRAALDDSSAVQHQHQVGLANGA